MYVIPWSLRKSKSQNTGNLTGATHARVNRNTPLCNVHIWSSTYIPYNHAKLSDGKGKNITKIPLATTEAITQHLSIAKSLTFSSGEIQMIEHNLQEA